MSQPRVPADLARLIQFISGDLPAASVADWYELGLLADRHVVFTLFCKHILDARAQVPPEAVAWVEPHVWEYKRRSLEIGHLIREINTRLEQAGISPIWLKGAALAYSAYASPWLRDMTDVDILVTPADHARAADLLIEAGYERAEEIPEQHSHHDVFWSPARDFKIESHYHLTPQIILPITPVQQAWFEAHTRQITTPHGMMRIFTPEAMLLHLAAHDVIQHDFADIARATDWSSIQLRRKLDMHQVIAADPPDWDAVIDTARDLGWDYAVGIAVRQLDLLFGTPIPARVFDALPFPLSDRVVISARRRQQLRLLRLFLRQGWASRLHYLRGVIRTRRSHG